MHFAPTLPGLTSRALLLAALPSLLTACNRDYKLVPEVAAPLTLNVTTPTYGEYLGLHDDTGALAISVTGTVSPASAQVMVNGQRATIDGSGNFSASIPWGLGTTTTDRAYVVDVQAYDPGESARQLVPVFDGNDPRDTDPGAINGLLTPTGLAALDPTVASMVDSLGIWDQLSAALPAISTTYVSITPTGITSSGTTAALTPAADAVTMLLTFHDVTMTADVDIASTYDFPMTVAFGEVTLGADAIPGLTSDDMLTLALSNAQADIQNVTLAFGDYTVPDWIDQLLVDPLASLVASLGGTLASYVLDQFGTIQLGGPFAFSTDLLGTPFSARLAQVDATTDGVELGLTESTTGDAATEMPVLTPLTAQTPSGLDYQLGFAVHEGLFNTLIDDVLGGSSGTSLLDIDLQLTGDMATLMGAGIAALPGGGYLPNDSQGYCLAFHGGDARVVRMKAGTGAPLAQLWLPDMQVGIQTIQNGTCTDWLNASVFATVDINVSGTQLSMDFNVVRTTVLSYGASESDPSIDLDAVGSGLGGIVNGFVGLALSQTSFDLSGLLGGFGNLPVTLNPQIVSVEPLGEEGRYGIFMNVF